MGRILQLVAKNAFQSIAPAAAVLVAVGGDTIDMLIAGAALFVLVTTVAAIARYLAFRYCVTANAVLIRDGVFHRKQLDIRFERIQAVNTTRGVLDRLFGLVDVSFDTAGSSAQEGQLPAVPTVLADALRERIDRMPKPAADEDSQPAGPRVTTLLRLGPGDMLRIAVSSSRVFLVLALIGPLSETMGLDLAERVEKWLLQAVGALEAVELPGALVWAGIVIAALALMFGGAVAAAFLRYHRFALTASATVLRSVGGLLTRHEHAVDRAKVQQLIVTQNIVLRRLRRFRLRLRQAASGRGADGSLRAFNVPLASACERRQVERRVFADEFRSLVLDPETGAFRQVSPAYIGSRSLVFGILPAVLAALVWLPIAGIAALAALLWIPVATALAWQFYRRLGVQVTADGLALRSGLLGYRLSTHLHRKVQKVTVSQSPLQRRRRLATVRISLAAGTVRIPFIDRADAERLRDLILYAVESSRRRWH